MNPMLRRLEHAQLRLRIAALACALATLVSSPASAAAVSVRDASGRDVAVTDPSRIVSIGGSVTEILYALGLERSVVGVDSTSFYPPRARAEKPDVGYMRALSPEGVLGLNPSLILAVEGTGPKDIVGMLQAARVPLVLVPDPYSGEGIVEKVRLIARATGAEVRGKCLADRVQTDLDALAALRQKVERPLRVMFVLSFQNGKAMVAGRKTAADGIITLAGATNVIGEYEGYKPINDEAIVAAKPDLILAMQRDSHPMTPDIVFSHPGLALTPAAERKALVAMDGLYLLGFGPRTVNAARDLIAAFYPALAQDGGPAPAPAAACAE